MYSDCGNHSRISDAIDPGDLPALAIDQRGQGTQLLRHTQKGLLPAPRRARPRVSSRSISSRE